jgi:hypothetical protein
MAGAAVTICIASSYLALPFVFILVWKMVLHVSKYYDLANTLN